MSEDELPEVVWRVQVAPALDRREQLRLYEKAMGVQAAQRQVRLHREELARQRARRRP